VQVDIRTASAGKDSALEQPFESGNAEVQAALVLDPGNDFRESEAHRECRQQKHKAGHRTGDSDIEENALRVDRRADANERAESAEQRRGKEVRQAGVDVVVERGEIVAELVRQQDGEQRE
jgi:hypothetical protein